MMYKFQTMAILICATALNIIASDSLVASNGEGEWQLYSQEPNGDVHFYDQTRVKSDANLHQVWNRIRYKTSIMGAASYQSLLEIDCVGGTERILQNTFFSDKHWEKPAMNTDRSEKPERLIAEDSASERLSAILCDE